MLKRINKIQGIGLFHDADGSQFELARGTLIYGDNGSGKTTLTSILRSAATGDPSELLERKTLDGTLPEHVLLEFDNGEQVEFDGSGWDAIRPELTIFDFEFVDRNVYTGKEVGSEHRKNLLNFALGSQAVSAMTAVDEASDDVKELNKNIRGLKKQLATYHGDMSLENFQILSPIADSKATIENLEQRIASARKSESLQRKAAPARIELPSLDLDVLFQILGSRLADIEVNAEQTVSEHLSKHGSMKAENWLNEGQEYEIGDTCPYCAQSLIGIGLVRAYRTYFNDEYNELKKRVSQLRKGIEKRTGNQVIKQFNSDALRENTVIRGWAEHAEFPEIQFNEEKATQKISELRELLLKLADKKESRPVDQVGTDEDKGTANELWTSVLEFMDQCNDDIDAVTSKINRLKLELERENESQLRERIEKIKIAQLRHEPQVAELVTDLVGEKENKKTLEKKKTEEKSRLNNLMEQTLATYSDDINSLLETFGASFRIAKIGYDYMGGSPKTRYALKLRGEQVKLSGSAPGFGTLLGDGDKRTLAFAFFVAKLNSDPDIGNKIVVIDDPMTGLDEKRRTQVRHFLTNIYNNSRQLIVLAHNKEFLANLGNDLVEATEMVEIKSLELESLPGGYSIIRRTVVRPKNSHP